MPQAAQRLEELLSAISQDPPPEWDELTRIWIDALLELDGMPEAHLFDRLGGPLRRRDRNALTHDIERGLQFLRLRGRDPSITVVWQ